MSSESQVSVSPLYYVVILVVAGLVGFGVTRWQEAQSSESSVALVTPVASPAVRPLFQEVSLLTDRAEPNTILIPVGGEVQFNSKDGRQHSLAQGEGDEYGHAHGHDQAGLESGLFGAEEGYKVTFKKTGAFFFHDHLNPKVGVSVVVY